MSTCSQDRYPAVSLFYKFDDRAVCRNHIELRDELEEYDDVELWGERRA